MNDLNEQDEIRERDGLRERKSDNRIWLKFATPIAAGAFLCWAGYVTNASMASGEVQAKSVSMEQKIDKLIEMATIDQVQSAELKKDISFMQKTMERNAEDSNKADEATNKRLDKIEEKLDR